MASAALPIYLSLSFLVICFTEASCQIPQPVNPRNLRLDQAEWRLLQESIGISAMHMQLLHNNKVVIFDRTDFGRSNISLPYGRCRFDPSDTVLQVDCTAHSVLYDVNANSFRPLMVQTDVWCSSGAVLPDGTLIQTGGYNDGDHVVRAFTPCDNDACDWVELPGYLAQRRWYATNQILPDGRIIIIGGRRQFNYEFYPHYPDNNLSGSRNSYFLEFLRETTDRYENNLYPFVHLLPDGNLFIFANTRSISFDYNQNRMVREFPPIPGANPRNYPSSGSSVLLPLDENKDVIEVEVMICGGARPGAFARAQRESFVRATSMCGRLKINGANQNWTLEEMPMARVMGDMLLLPTGDITIINGAGRGTAGWENGRDPVMRPVIYRPTSRRFSVMSASPRARMYHSSAVLLADGRILVGGSNPHLYYNFTGVLYPTDLSLESFSPPYLSPEYGPVRPIILSTSKVLGYRQPLSATFTVPEYLSASVLTVAVIAPSFTTHSLSMNQRMVVLKVAEVQIVTAKGKGGIYTASALGPSSAEVAPPGYYLLFVVHANIPSSGAWVKIQN